MEEKASLNDEPYLFQKYRNDPEFAVDELPLKLMCSQSIDVIDMLVPSSQMFASIPTRVGNFAARKNVL
jgi:hypothetical protein